MSDSKRNCQICPLCGKLYKGTDNLVEYNGEKMCRNCYGILEREFFPIEGIDPDGEENPDYQEGYRQGASYMNRQWMRKIIQHYKKPMDTTTIEERANVPQNRFKGAFLGDLFICKDGTELLYACTKDNKAVLANGIGPKGKARLRTYNLDGTSTDGDDGKRIIGKIKYKKNFEEEIVYFEEKH